MKIRLEVSGKTKSQLTAGIMQEGSVYFSQKVMTNAQQIDKAVMNRVVDRFRKTQVVQSILNTGSIDLQAHLGLTPVLAKSLVDGMEEMIRNSFRLASVGTGNSVSISIQAVDDNWQTYLSLPGATYISKSSGIEIPVLGWLLIDPSIDIGQASYEIIFRGYSSKMDTRINKCSRSRRAIMVSLEELGGGGGYVLPAIISGNAGQNFIEYAIRQRAFAEEIGTIVMDIIG